jgi:hypothetical protein
VDKAKPGQILAEKLTRHDGVLLASQGAEISEGLLRMLARLNIDTVVIEEDDLRSQEEVLADFQCFKEALEARFAKVDGQPVLMALKKTMLYLAEKEKDETLALLAPPEAEAAPASPEVAALPENAPGSLTAGHKMRPDAPAHDNNPR